MTYNELMVAMPQFIADLDGYRGRIQGIWSAFGDLEKAPKEEWSTHLNSLREVMADSAAATEEMKQWLFDVHRVWPWLTEKADRGLRTLLTEIEGCHQTSVDPLASERQMLGLDEEFGRLVLVLESCVLRGLAGQLAAAK